MFNPFSRTDRTELRLAHALLDSMDAFGVHVGKSLSEKIEALVARSQRREERCAYLAVTRGRARRERDEALAELAIHRAREARRMAGREKAVVASAEKRRAAKEIEA